MTIGIYYAIIPSFIREISAKKKAPYFGTAPVTNESLGSLFAFIFGLCIYEWTNQVRVTWVTMTCIDIFPLVVILICIKLNVIYESPIYHLRTGQRNKALDTYYMIYQ